MRTPWKPSATTLERLATDSDRMVGVITHVPALAERVPVRFVVSHTGGDLDAAQGTGMTDHARSVAFTVDPWDPGYGLAYSEELDGGALEESSAELNLDLEVPAAQWRPLTPDPAPRLPGTVLFLDGVRRIDARIWVHGRNPQPAPGIAASLAAGLVCCDGAARVADVSRRARPVHLRPRGHRHRHPVPPVTPPGSPQDPDSTSSRSPCSSGSPTPKCSSR